MLDCLTYSLGDKFREAFEFKERIENAKRLLREWFARMMDDA